MMNPQLASLTPPHRLLRRPVPNRQPCRPNSGLTRPHAQSGRSNPWSQHPRLQMAAAWGNQAFAAALRDLNLAQWLTVAPAVRTAEDANIRREFVRGLRNISATVALSCLANFVDDRSEAVRHQVVKTLAALGTIGITMLRPMADDPCLWVARAAVRAMAKVDSSESTAGLLDLLSNRDIFLANIAIEALATRSDPRVVVGLTHGALNCAVPWLQRRALRQLATRDVNAARWVLANLYGKIGPSRRASLTGMLGRFSPEAPLRLLGDIMLFNQIYQLSHLDLDALDDMLHDPRTCGREWRIAGAELLRRAGLVDPDMTTFDHVLALCDQLVDRMPLEVARALHFAPLRRAAALPLLETLCTHSLAKVRQGAAETLSLYSEDIIVVAMAVDMLDDAETLVKQAASYSLGRMAATMPSAHDVICTGLQQLQQDSDPAIRVGVPAKVRHIFTTAALQALRIAALDTHQSVQLACVWPLSDWLGPAGPQSYAVAEAAIIFKHLAQDGSFEVRKAVAEACAHLSFEQAHQIMKVLVNDPHPAVRCSLATALQNFVSEPALRILDRLHADEPEFLEPMDRARSIVMAQALMAHPHDLSIHEMLINWAKRITYVGGSDMVSLACCNHPLKDTLFKLMADSPYPVVTYNVTLAVRKMYEERFTQDPPEP